LKLFASIDQIPYDTIKSVKTVADIGSGSAIFSLIFLLVLSRKQIRVEKLILSDIFQELEIIGITNFNLNRKFIKANKIEFIKSDVVDNIDD